ncbi:MAG TPA: hypothetical protein VFJ15_03875 [Oleiagrimonas sp.]|nr:hypothetical protein [Oleiagrimonas sp.]
MVVAAIAVMLAMVGVLAGMACADPATGGVITFTGAVVNPTCTASGERLALTRDTATAQLRSRQLTCYRQSAGRKVPLAHYHLTIRQANATSSSLLGYYAQWMHASGEHAAWVVTRTYR